MDTIKMNIKMYDNILITIFILKMACKFGGATQSLCKNDSCKICFEKSFASSNKCKYWSSLNDPIKPRDVFKQSNHKYHFTCSNCKHTFKAIICNFYQGTKCPFCAKKKLCDNEKCKMCFNNSFASNEKSKYWSSRNDTQPRYISKCNSKKCWFDCPKCQHTFASTLNHVTSDERWCPYCENKKLCNNDKCMICFNNSFASYDIEKVKCWSAINNIEPRYVIKCSNTKYFFVCHVCAHTFSQTPDKVVKRSYWCPYCSQSVRKLCGVIGCKFCYNNSFASYDNKKVKCWSDKNTIKPFQAIKYSGQKYLFECDKCLHSFEARLNDILNNQWCPYCAIPSRVLCDNPNCKFCYERSFASHEKAKYFSKENNIDCRKLLKHSKKKYWFVCNKCSKKFDIALSCVADGIWCRFCKNKTERILLEWLVKIFDEKNVNFQKAFHWCKNIKTNQCFPFDFYINNYSLIIELDGEQHFTQISNWKSPKDAQKRDLLKMKLALRNNKSVIRLLQEDVLYNKIDWKNELVKYIVEYTEPCVICIENGDKYDIDKINEYLTSSDE